MARPVSDSVYHLVPGFVKRYKIRNERNVEVTEVSEVTRLQGLLKSVLRRRGYQEQIIFW
jgi:hypothetical protein